jgi:hypothetical protein
MKFNLEYLIIKRILKALNGKSFDDVILDSEIIKEFSHFLMVLDLQVKKISKFRNKASNIEGIFEFVFEDSLNLIIIK